MNPSDTAVLLRAAERIRNLSVDSAGQQLAEELARIALGRCEGPSDRISLAASLAGLDRAVRLPPSRRLPRIEKSAYSPEKLLRGYTRWHLGSALGFTQDLPPGDDLEDIRHATLLIGQPLRRSDEQLHCRLQSNNQAKECATDVEAS